MVLMLMLCPGWHHDAERLRQALLLSGHRRRLQGEAVQFLGDQVGGAGRLRDVVFAILVTDSFGASLAVRRVVLRPRSAGSSAAVGYTGHEAVVKLTNAIEHIFDDLADFFWIPEGVFVSVAVAFLTLLPEQLELNRSRSGDQRWRR